METGRREFVKGAAWVGALAAVSGPAAAAGGAGKLSAPGSMTLYADKPLAKVRTGHVGLGMRGPGAVHRIASIPGAEVTALCDLYENRVKRQQDWLAKNGKPAAKEYSGPEGYKALCESSDIDLVYVTTPWALHAPVALYAMEHGKHVAIEVPSAMSLDECWALVETSERTGRHCMQLENCCYGEIEMLTLNMVRQGLFGELVHAEGAYIHDLRGLMYRDPAKGGYQDWWRLRWNVAHQGNCYPTHGLVPLMQHFGVNRGDRFDYLTCVASAQIGMDLYAETAFAEDAWQRKKLAPQRGDMSTTVIRTERGRTIMVQHDVTSARPYSRIQLVSGTRGIIKDYPFEVALADKPGGGAHSWFDPKRREEIRAKYKHPLWKTAGELAKKIGGHGGMDFLMDLRLCYCLQNGLPLDMDVYDLAASCSLCELTERSARNRGATQDVPDFTRGAWKSNPPIGIVDIDLAKLGFGEVKKDEAQLTV